MFKLQIRTPKVISMVLLLSSMVAGCGGRTSTSLPPAPSIEQLPSTAGASNGIGLAPLGIAPQDGISAYSQAVLASHPLAYYQLNDSSSALVDSGPHGITGTYGSSVSHHAQPITQGASGASGFPGGSSYNPNGFASTRPTTVLQPSTVSVEVWFKKTAAAAVNSHIPIAVYGDAKGVNYGLYLEGLGSNIDRIYYQQRNTGQGTLLFHGMTHLSVGVVYHVVATFDGTHVTTYINGLLDQTAAYPGAIGYSFSHLSQGAQIGGEKIDPTYTGFPSFPGTIAQVAIYGAALPQQTVIGHFLAGQLLPMIAETARPSDSFVDSIGINTHFNSNHSIYITQFSQVAKMLAASGIRHLRDNISFGSDFISKMKQLAASNIHATYITLPTMKQSQIQGYPSLISPSLEQFEAPNEQDDQGNPNWPPGCAAFQKTLYSWVKGDPSIAHYPVLGPGLAFAVNYAKLGDLSAYLDTGNFHDYMGAYNPGFPGGPWNGMKAMLSDEQVTSDEKAVMSTETGYGTVGSYPSLDNRTHLRYMTRMFFEQFNAGIERSYSYEFIDESTKGGFSSFGLVNGYLAAKPAYTGIKSLIGALQDPGSPFTTSSLTYSLSGLSSVHHLLMQKRNRTFILALWLEVPSWNEVGGGDIIVPNQNVTLTTASNIVSAAVSTMDENGNFTTSSLPWKNKQTTISVSDKVSLVTLTP